MITLGVPLLPPTFLQLTIFICLLLLLLPPLPPLLITIVPTDPPTVTLAAAATSTDEPEPDEQEDDNDDDDDAAATVGTGMPDRNEGGAVRPADHEVCLTTITPGRHCWCCWRICDAVCWATLEEVAEGEGLQLPAASATEGVMETETIAGLPLLGLLEVLLLEGGMVEEEVAEEADGQVPIDGGVRNVRYGSS